MRFAFQGFAKIRMADGEHAADAIGDRLAAQLGRAEFRYDYVRIAARRRDYAAELRNDPAELAATRRRRHRDDRTSMRCQLRSAHEIALAADRADVDASSDLGIDLSGQIDLDGGIYYDEFAELADNLHAMCM